MARCVSERVSHPNAKQMAAALACHSVRKSISSKMECQCRHFILKTPGAINSHWDPRYPHSMVAQYRGQQKAATPVHLEDQKGPFAHPVWPSWMLALRHERPRLLCEGLAAMWSSAEGLPAISVRWNPLECPLPTSDLEFPLVWNPWESETLPWRFPTSVWPEPMLSWHLQSAAMRLALASGIRW